MKNLFFVMLLSLIPFSVFSQSKKSIDGFLDIPFRSDSATVKAAIISRGGIRHDTVSHKDYLVFTGLTMSGRKVFFSDVRFVNNKAYQADFAFGDFNEKDILTYYENLSNDISAVYGNGTLTNNFTDADNSTRIQKLRSGSATCWTVWQSENKNTITLTYLLSDQVLYITLKYQCERLWLLNASKSKSDF
jgi:hypothetical protein